jgi:hypothetical protein
MKHLVFLLISSVAALAWAQAPTKPEPAKEPAKAEAPKPAAESAKQAAAASRKGAPRRWNEDARHCLERASTTEIIKCAEEFL